MTCLGHAPDFEQFARDNQDIVQVVGVGAREDFDSVQEFIQQTELNSIPILWEQSANFWRLNNVSTNSAMQLFSHDLTQQSGVIFFNDSGRGVVLDAAVQRPWKPGA